MRKIIAIMLSIAMLSMVFVSFPMATAKAPAQNSVLDQVWTGNQTINSPVTITDETIWVTGNITITGTGSLTLVNSTIVMNCTAANRTYIEVQNGGSLILQDGGDGFTPMDGSDSDASMITNNASAYNLWVLPGGNFNVQNSIIEYVGNNTDIPPNPWSGIFIQSDSVSIEHSLIQDGNHGLIFDSCFPASFMYNEINGMAGFGVAIGALSNPFYNITGTISNNVIYNNGGSAIELHGMNIDVEVFNLEIYDNNYGICIYGDDLAQANIHNNEVYHNSGGTDSGASAVYVKADDTGETNVTFVNNLVYENNCGGVRIGFQYSSDMSYNTRALIANNSLYGNEGGNMVDAENNVYAKVVDNYLGGSNYNDQVDRFKLGLDPGNSVACQNLTFEYCRNTVWCGKAGDQWNVGGVLKTGAQKEIVGNIHYNDVRGGYEFGGIFWLGSSRDDWNYMPENLTAYVSHNYVEILYDHDAGQQPYGSYLFTFDSQFNTYVEFTNNTYYSTFAMQGGPDYGNSLIYMGADDSEGDMTYNLTALVEGNSIITHHTYADSFKSAYLCVNAKYMLDMTVRNNFFEFYDYYSPSYYWNGFLIFGDARDSSYGPKYMYIDVYDNDFHAVLTDGYGIAPGGVCIVTPSDTVQCEWVFLNFTRNNILIESLSDSWVYTGGGVIVGDPDDDYYPTNCTAVINDNTMILDVPAGAYTGTGSVIITAEENLDVTMENNYIECKTTVEDNYPFGVRLGYYCYSNGIITEDLNAKLKNNVIISNGEHSSFISGSNNHTDITIEGGMIGEAMYGSCGSSGSFGTEHTYGNGIVMLSENTLDATIKDVEIYDNDGAGIYVDIVNDGTVDIENCYIHDNKWDGIRLMSQMGHINALGSIDNCIIIDNGGDEFSELPDYGSGIYLWNVSADIVNCTIDNPDGNYDLELDENVVATTLNTVFDKSSVDIYGEAAVFTGETAAEANFATWAAVTDGSFRISIDGEAQDIDGIDFTGDASMANVATTITNALQAVGTDAFIGAVCTWNGDHFVITSGSFGPLSNVSATTTTTNGTVGTDISGLGGSDWMDTDAGTYTDGFGSELWVKWYLDVKTLQLSSGKIIIGASVDVYDVYGAGSGSGTTGMDGILHWIQATEYYETTSHKVLYTDHDIDASMGAASDSATTTMDTSKEITIVLDYASAPPVANAGSDISVAQDVNFTLDGSGSTDDLGIVSWDWVCGNVTLSGETVNYSYAVPGVYEFNLTVTDVEGYSDTDTVNVTVLDAINPIADAGPDMTVNEDAAMNFNGNGSYDAAGIANYTWVSGTITLYGETPTYTFDEPGEYTFTLTVSDPTGNTDSDDVVVTVLDITAPVVDAGSGQTVAVGTIVTLDGTGSSDNVGIVSYVWEFNDGANDIVLTGSTVDYLFNQIENVTVTLTCTDAAGNSGVGTTYVNVVDSDAPGILVVAPGESLTGVPIDWQLIIVFDEPMNTGSVEDAFSINGTTVVSFTWDPTNTYVTVELGELAYETQYTFSIATNATDTAGNHMGTAYTGTFTTMAEPTGQDGTEPTEPETNFFTDNWWILVVIIVVLAVLLLLQMLKGGSKEQAETVEPEAEVVPAPVPEGEAAPEPEMEPEPEEPEAPEPEEELDE